VPRVLAAAASQPADGPHRHVLIAKNLTTQPNTRQSARRQHVSLSNRRPAGFPRDKLDATRRTARVAAARMQLINSRVLLESQDQPFPLRDLEFSDTLDRKFGHVSLPATMM
jgi:hypothetical protein